MREHHRRSAAVFVALVVAAAAGEFPRQSLAQNPADDGHSYMHIMIGDHVLTNYVGNEEYRKGGWLTIESVLIKSTGQTRGAVADPDRLPKGWGFLSAEMKSGHHGPGTLSFGVGDNGGLAPLLAAQKNGTIIPSAALDLFPDYGKGRTLIGKYLVKRIRIVAVEDVPASACGMYDVTVRFQSIEPRETRETQTPNPNQTQTPNPKPKPGDRRNVSWFSTGSPAFFDLHSYVITTNWVSDSNDQSVSRSNRTGYG